MYAADESVQLSVEMLSAVFAWIFVYKDKHHKPTVSLQNQSIDYADS